MNMRSCDPLVGQTLDDRYQIVRRVARGGMATVYEATDVRLDRVVAVKVMHAGLGCEDDIVARFDSEARSAALLSHPNVVAVFDQGRDCDRPFIVMEYVRGLTLRQLVSLEAPFSPERALQLFEPVVAALAHAHAAGLVHRDIKPENVLISERGHVKVADFGLAHAVTQSTVAQGGVVIGTVSYIAPELVSRGLASKRSDVYSLGIVLYELLTGEKPHRGGSPVEVAYSHVHKDVPAPSASDKVTEAIPGFLDALVATTCARVTASRQQDAQVLLCQVRAARDTLARGTTSPAALSRLMRATTADEADRAAADLPRLVGAARSSGVRTTVSVPAAGEPPASAVTSATREIHLTPSTGPGTDDPSTVMRDGGPSRSSDSATPISPYSPPARGVPRHSDWVQTPMHRRRRQLTAAVVAALVLTLALSGWWATAGRLPAVPRLAGLELADARTSITGSGLTVQFVQDFSETVPAGMVIRSDPAEGGRLERGSIVLVYLSQGPRLSEVPALQGKTQDEALRLLSGAGLGAGAVTERYNKATAGTVISQSATAGVSLHRGAAIDFVLSQGLEPVDVGDWIGKPTAAATKALVAAGLHVKVTYDDSSTIAKGSVVAQSPAAGQARKGDTVTLVSSRGAKMIAVPDVRKLDSAAAGAQLEAAGFTVLVTASPTITAGPTPVVVSTRPVGGTRAAQGSQVTLYLG